MLPNFELYANFPKCGTSFSHIDYTFNTIKSKELEIFFVGRIRRQFRLKKRIVCTNPIGEHNPFIIFSGVCRRIDVLFKKNG